MKNFAPLDTKNSVGHNYHEKSLEKTSIGNVNFYRRHWDPGIYRGMVEIEETLKNPYIIRKLRWGY